MDSKKWWQSKTLWTATLGMVGALVLTFVGDGAYQSWIALEAPVMAILTIVFRWTAKAGLTK